MSRQLIPLLLPQRVENRKVLEVHQHAPDSDLSHVYYTTNNSSASDVATPLTPTFSPRGHYRFSSSTSSLDLPPQLQDTPSSPVSQQSSSKPPKSQLPDVQEEPTEPPMESVEHDDDTIPANTFGLYSCLCDEPCEHGRSSSEDMLPGDVIGDWDIDYDLGFLSDGDSTADPGYSRKKYGGTDSPLMALTARFGSRFPSINRWASNKRTNLMSSPTTELTFENVLSRAPSSRSSSISAPARRVSERSAEPPMPPTPEMFYDSTDSFHQSASIDIDQVERESLERDRAMATTPLLPPLLTAIFAELPVESPLQSPSIAPSSVVTEIHSPLTPTAPFPRPSLSTKPSTTSLRRIASGAELALPLPAIMQEHDEWSDRLGHANFTITPLPYEPDAVTTDSIGKFCSDWDTAKVNYTRHLVRTGENYGQTSKIYALTEAKWAETERRWNLIHEELMKQAGNRSAPAFAATRSRSRGRTRGRSGSASAAFMRRIADDDYADMQWRRLEDGCPGMVPQMLEALDAEGKFPSRGDEDIVGPMHRVATMVRAQSEERRGARFWKNLAERVGLRK